ncbi:cytochrome P450, partial [Lojkania enalia]
NSLSISDGDALKQIYGGGRAFQKTEMYDGFTAIRPNIFGMRDEDLHASRKRMLNHGFSVQSVTSMEPYIDGCIAKLRLKLDEFTKTGEAFDLALWFSFLGFDILGELAFSKSFDILASSNPNDMPPFLAHGSLAAVGGQIPWFLKALPYLQNLPISTFRHLTAGRAALRQFAIDSVNARIAAKDEARRDLLYRLLEAKDPSTGEQLELEDIQTEAFGFIIAGSGTSASTLSILFWHLLHQPQIIETLVQELDENLPSLPESQQVYTYTDTSRLRYLSAVLKENFQINPVFTLPLGRSVPEGGTTVAGSFIPGSVEVFIINHVLHHNPEIFGYDHAEFKVDRWLGPQAKELAQFLSPFSTGHRACIGRNIVNFQIYKVVTTLLRNHKLEAVDGGQPGQIPTSTLASTHLHGLLMVRVYHR